MQESSKNQQWIIWAAIGAGILIIGCIVCVVGVVLFGFLPFALFGVSAPVQNVGSPSDPTNPDSTLYRNIAETQLDEFERATALLREAIEKGQQDSSSDWQNDAFADETLIANAHDVLAAITPPSAVASLHEEVMGAANLCYELYMAMNGNPDSASLQAAHDLTEECDARVDAARSALETFYGSP